MSSFSRKVEKTYGGMPVMEWLSYMKERYDGIPVNGNDKDCLVFEIKGTIPGSDDVNNYHIPSLHAVLKGIFNLFETLPVIWGLERNESFDIKKRYEVYPLEKATNISKTVKNQT